MLLAQADDCSQLFVILKACKQAAQGEKKKSNIQKKKKEMLCMVLTFLQKLEAILQAALVAHKKQAPVFLRSLRLLLALVDLGTVLDAPTNHTVRVDRGRDVQVTARVHLADVRRKGALLLRAARERKVVPRRQFGIVLERRQGQGRARLPAARHAGAEQFAGVHAGIVDVW